MASIKSRVARLANSMGLDEGTPLTRALRKYAVKDRYRTFTFDQVMLLDTMKALVIKDCDDHQKYGFAREFLTWASTRPELALIERAENILKDLAVVGFFSGSPPPPWEATTVDPGTVQPHYPWFCTAEQLATCPEHPFW